MTSFHPLIALLQVIAAFMIFVVSYLALFVFVILCLVSAVSIYKGADFVRAYTVKSNSLCDRASSESKENTGGSLQPRRRIHHAFSGASLFRSAKHQ